MLTITDRAAIETVFAAFGADLSRTVAHHINLAVLENDCCRASFLRGAFLAGGSVTDPSKNYHLELITAHASVSRETAALLTELGFAARSIDRGANTVLYFKKSEAIEDFLTKIGAPCAAMDIMSAKVEKSMNNTINRKVNCDTANADKVVAAAQEQIDAIRRGAAAHCQSRGQPGRPRHALVSAGDEELPELPAEKTRGISHGRLKGTHDGVCTPART